MNDSRIDSALEGKRHYNRQRKLTLTPDLLCSFFTKGEKDFLVEEGVPDTFCCRGATIDPLTGHINIFISHPTFDIVPEGGAIPNMEIRVNTDPKRIFRNLGTDTIQEDDPF